MGEALVIGHRNPSTDAVCPAIGDAESKRRTGMREGVEAHRGDTDERIDFVLAEKRQQRLPFLEPHLARRAPQPGTA